MQEVELTTEKMAFEGKAIARQNRFVIFVEGALPNEKVRARIFKKKRTFAEARVLEVIDPSPHRIAAPCPMFGTCGGCSFQHMEYAAQIEMKRDVLLESLHGVEGVPDRVQPTIGAEWTAYFRNKMGYAFGFQEDLPVLGLHRKGQWHSVVPADACLLQSPESNEILRKAARFAAEGIMPVFNDRTGEGVLRHLVVREGKHTNQRMLHLHVAAQHPAIPQLVAELDSLCDTFLLSCHKSVPEAAKPEETNVLKGEGRIFEKLNGFTFEIGPSTFFQTNTVQAERLFQVVDGWARELNPKVAVDLYSGTGPIAIHLAAGAERVLAVESNKESVQMARRNLELNSLTNVELRCAEVERMEDGVLPMSPDLVVVDPPRAGLHKKAMKLLLECSPSALIYVSCNPATLGRDLKLLNEGGYRAEVIQPLDMFPHTFHIETAALLRKA